jgi:hypothetical protein
MAHVDDFDDVVALDRFEPIPLDNLGADVFNARRLSGIRVLRMNSIAA